MEFWLTTVYWAIAIVASLLYGWHAVSIFKAHIAGVESQPPTAWWWHPRWLNFLGALVGWTALWLLLRKFSACIFQQCSSDPSAWDVAGAFVAFIGVTGYLPATVVSLVAGVGALAGKLTETLNAWISNR